MRNEDRYIRLDDLSVGYNGKAVIRDICIDIRKGEIVTLIGPNGAGKSTILKSITRQLSLIGGKVILEEKDMHRMPFREISKKMAVVLTERLKTDLLTCYDIVASGRYPYTGKLGLLTEEDEKKVDEAISAVHAEELGPKDFNAVSDGQRQRILLARAICQDPEIIVLDEPTSFLDIRYKLELLAILRSMAKENGITVIMSLHEIDLAEKISDRVVCVKGDRIYRYGAPDDIFREDVIKELYELDNGFFDPFFGSIELPAPGAGREKTPAPVTGGTEAHASDTGGKETHAPDAGSMETHAPDAGSMEAHFPDAGVKEPQVFVISSGGTGIPVYRKLQKENTPFAAGILAPNDIDYRLARLLAAEVITSEPFEPLSEESLEKGRKMIDKCRRVIFAEYPTGSTNKDILELVEYAREKNLLEVVRAPDK